MVLDELTRRRLEGVIAIARIRLAGNTMHSTWDLIFDGEALLRGEQMLVPTTAEELIRMIGEENARH